MKKIKDKVIMLTVVYGLVIIITLFTTNRMENLESKNNVSDEITNVLVLGK